MGPGSTFVAIKGMKHDGIDYINQALARGATSIVSETAIDKNSINTQNVCFIHVENARKALAILSAQAYDYPAKKLKFIAITGTKGKTTCSFLIEHLLRFNGYKTALLSTVKNSINGTDFPTKLTTQQPDYLHTFFNLCVENNVEWVIIEVAAQAFSLHRIAGLEFDAAIFTNFSKEHGEFYATMDDYFAAKKEIINYLKPQAPLILNAHDTRVKKLSEHYSNAILFDNNQTLPCPKLIGRFNNYNCAAVITCLKSLHLLNSDQIKLGLQTFNGVPGRIERYELPNGSCAIIDYAHNPSSYEAILGELSQHTDHLIVVFGCGGDRDASRRPLMGSIASKYANLMLLTSDNPRSEDPAQIVQDICSGINDTYHHKIIIELDRERAIKMAYHHARKNSIIALLGKGPDEYQIIKGVTTFFSEKQILQNL